MGQPYPSAVPPARRLNEADRIAAIGHARAAVALGNDDATALAIAALVIAYDGHDIAMALRVFDRVLELSNCNVFVLCWNAAILAWIGKAELAIERPAGAPTGTVRFVDLWRANHALSIAYFHGRRYDDAANAAQSLVDANPAYSLPRAILAAAFMGLGRDGSEDGGADRVGARALLFDWWHGALRRTRTSGVQALC